MKLAATVGIVLALPVLAFGAATVTETRLVLPTYPFSDPDPVPATDLPRYPYFFIDGSSETAVSRAWTAVVLENERVKVTLLPEIGGKVWGATEKRTGRDFVYFNHVVKFRNIAQRGPWCSGGIEFNFGTFGHGPWTSAPVSYFTRTNSDGSASCFVSETDLVTLTTWQVEVNLPSDAEGFVTRTVWYNGSGFPAPYYQWMNAAFSVRGQPTLEFPGRAYVGHGGDAHAWPVDGEGRDLRKVAKNDFGKAKSEHVVNGDNGFYGIWWPGENGQGGMGVVHCNDISQKYGRKIWLWPPGRAGGLWEDLLTDQDGQYTELQSGRAFNQPEPESARTPFKHPTFAAGATDSFEEKWKVVRDRKDFEAAWDERRFVTRPLESPPDFNWETAYGHYLLGEQLLRQRKDCEGERELRKALDKEPHFVPALNLLATLAVRRGECEKAHEMAGRALAVNTYEPEANYADGLAFLAEGRLRAARERLGLAAYSQSFRSAACETVARIELREGRLDAATEMADRALSANAVNFDALLVKIVVARLSGRVDEAKSLAERMLSRLPLFHAARYELGRLSGDRASFVRFVRNEFPHETFLSLGTWYESAGLEEDAAYFFGLAGEKTPIGLIRRAYVLHRRGERENAADLLRQAVARPIAFALPFRRETLPALTWAAAVDQTWKPAYYRAVLLAALGRDGEADRMLDACGENPNEAVFYLYRATRRSGEKALTDLRRAAVLGDSWRVGLALFAHFALNESWAKALQVTADYERRGLVSNKMNLAHANALVRNGRNEEAVGFMKTKVFLPSEHGDNAGAAWMDAWRGIALEALTAGNREAAVAAVRQAVSYPENLGVGKPLEPDFGPGPNGRRNPLADFPAELQRIVRDQWSNDRLKGDGGEEN